MSKLKIGVLARLTDSPADEIHKVADFGLPAVQYHGDFLDVAVFPYIAGFTANTSA